MAQLEPLNFPKCYPSEIEGNGRKINEPDDQNAVAPTSTLPGTARISKKSTEFQVTNLNFYFLH